MTKYQLQVILKSGDKVKVIGSHFKKHPGFQKIGKVRQIKRDEAWCMVELQGVPEQIRCLPEDVDFVEVDRR